MRGLRLVCALVLAAGLAILPVAVSFAMTPVAKSEAGTSAPGDDCSCCKPAKADSCFLKCCHVLAVAIDGLAIAQPPTPRFLVSSAERPAAVALRPDPPPPRT